MVKTTYNTTRDMIIKFKKIWKVKQNWKSIEI